jgi:hypothetical protein
MDTRRHVLVIESGWTCGHQLEVHGFQVTALRDTDAAMHAARELAPDAIVVFVEDEAPHSGERLALIPRLQTSALVRGVLIAVALGDRTFHVASAAAKSFGVPVLVFAEATAADFAATLNDLIDWTAHTDAH